MTMTNKRQIQGRGYPYLIFDTTQHKHLRLDGVVNFQVHKEIGPLDTMLRQQMMYWLSAVGIPTIHAAAMFLDAQYVEVRKAEATRAEVSFYFVEQMKIGGFFTSDLLTRSLLLSACQDALRYHFLAFNHLIRKELKWITFATIDISQVEHRVALTPQLQARMEQAESDYWAHLQHTSKHTNWSFLAPLREDSASRFLNALEHYGHEAAIHEEELMDFGFVPQGRKLTFCGPDGKPTMDIYGLVRADTRDKVPLSYVVPHDSPRGYVVSRDIDQLDRMAAADFSQQAPPVGPDLERLATNPALTAPPAEPRPQQPDGNGGEHEQS